jgi:hypothetical protein
MLESDMNLIVENYYHRVIGLRFCLKTIDVSSRYHNG